MARRDEPDPAEQAALAAALAATVRAARARRDAAQTLGPTPALPARCRGPEHPDGATAWVMPTGATTYLQLAGPDGMVTWAEHLDTTALLAHLTRQGTDHAAVAAFVAP